MKLRILALIPTVAVLIALNVIAARGRERTVTTTTEVAGASVPTDELLQHGRNLFSAKGCASCHVQIQVGPSLTNVKDRAAKAKPGFTAEQYVRESIVAPSAFKTPGSTSNEMPTLPVSTAELDALVAYVLTL